jgi:hypothetical protein
MSADTVEELEYLCRAYRDELEDIVSGDVKKCPMCDTKYSKHTAKNGRVTWSAACDCKHKYPKNKTKPEEYTMFDYLRDDALDVRYVVDAQGDLLSVRYTVACGGPSCYFNTDTGLIEGYWGGDEYKLVLGSDATRQIEDVAEEMYSYIRRPG